MMMRGPEHLSYKEAVQKLDLFNVEKRRLRGDLFNVYKYHQGRCQGDGARLFSAVSSDSMRSSGCKLGSPTSTQGKTSFH